MMDMQTVARAVNGTQTGVNTTIHSVNTDSRKTQCGELFVALTGENFDGHDFIESAVDNGAHGALVAQSLNIALPQVVVSDTERALGDLAGFWRRKFDIPVVAVTGFKR